MIHYRGCQAQSSPIAYQAPATVGCLYPRLRRLHRCPPSCHVNASHVRLFRLDHVHHRCLYDPPPWMIHHRGCEVAVEELADADVAAAEEAEADFQHPGVSAVEEDSGSVNPMPYPVGEALAR